MPYLATLGLSRHLARQATLAVSFLELAIGLLLLSRIAGQWVAAAAAGAAITFVIIHLASMLSHGLEPCRCFGAVDAELGATAGLIRAALLAAAAILVAAHTWMMGHSPLEYDLYALVSGALASFTYIIIFPLLDRVPKVLKLSRELRAGLILLRQELDSRTR